MLVLQTTEYGKAWHSWATHTIKFFGESWVNSIPITLLKQKAPENWKELQQLLNTKIRLFELVAKEPLAISPLVNGKHMHAIFCDIQTRYWEGSSNPEQVVEISYSIFMSCLEEGLITLAEHQLKNDT